MEADAIFTAPSMPPTRSCASVGHTPRIEINTLDRGCLPFVSSSWKAKIPSADQDRPSLSMSPAFDVMVALRPAAHWGGDAGIRVVWPW